MATKIDPKRIRTDLDTQIRVDWNEEAVKEYAELMERGIEFPPILVFFDDQNNQFILADGFHRLEAHRQVKPNDQILAEQQLGDVEDAKWAAIIANQSHGIRRTSADKRNAIKQAFRHSKGCGKSDHSIANDIGVDHKTVGAVRRELELTGEIPQSDFRTGQDGRTINTSGIHANRKETEQPSFPVNTSRINFGSKVVPEGATCEKCRYFENQKCLTDEIENPLPWTDVCGEFEVRVEETPPDSVPPPDYENVKPLGRKLKQTRQQRQYQNRDLKNCITVSLPSDNAPVFATELRNHWEKPYLTECLAALKHLLEEDDD